MLPFNVYNFDFIDESFLDDEIETTKPVMTKGLKEVKEWVGILKKEIGGRRLLSAKRLKTGEFERRPDLTVLSPLLGLLVAVQDMMVESDWKQRQAAANLARVVLAHVGKGISYFHVSKGGDDFKVIGQGEVLVRDFS